MIWQQLWFVYMHGISNPIQLLRTSAYLLVSFQLICLGFSVMNSTFLSNMGALGLNIYVYRCRRLCTMLSSNLCICEKFCQVKLEGHILKNLKNNNITRYLCCTRIITNMICKLMLHGISGNSNCTVRQKKSACYSALFVSWSKQWRNHEEKMLLTERDRW